MGVECMLKGQLGPRDNDSLVECDAVVEPACRPVPLGGVAAGGRSEHHYLIGAVD